MHAMSEFNSSFEPPEDSLTSMLLHKEKELQQLSRLRINQLQEQITFKDKTIFDLESHTRRLQDDLSYNLSLIQQRDEEIADLESGVASLTNENSLFPLEQERLHSEITSLRMKLEKSEDYIRELQGSREVCNEMQGKLQEAYTQLSKIKYEQQFNIEKYRELENNAQDISSMAQQYKGQIQEKDCIIQKLIFEKENSEKERAEFQIKLRNEKEKYDREIVSIKNKHNIDLQQIKELKESSVEQLGYTHKLQIEKLQSQVKNLLEDNKKINKQVEYYQNSLLEKERELNQEIYDLRKDVTFNLQQIEELQASVRAKEMENNSIKDHIDHWKNLAQSRADELFKHKQLQIRSDEKAENYLKELDSVKNESFSEIQRLKRELDSFVQERKSKFMTEKSEGNKYREMGMEIEKLNDVIYSKDKENNRLSMMVENLRKERERNFTENDEQRNVSFKAVTQRQTDYEGNITNKNTNRSVSRGNSYGGANRSKIYQVKSNLDRKFLESGKN